MSLDPDSLPPLLSIPVDELTNDDIDALRLLRVLAERHDWDGMKQLFIEHTRQKSPTKRSKP